MPRDGGPDGTRRHAVNLVCLVLGGLGVVFGLLREGTIGVHRPVQGRLLVGGPRAVHLPPVELGRGVVLVSGAESGHGMMRVNLTSLAVQNRASIHLPPGDKLISMTGDHVRVIGLSLLGSVVAWDVHSGKEMSVLWKVNAFEKLNAFSQAVPQIDDGSLNLFVANEWGERDVLVIGLSHTRHQQFAVLTLAADDGSVVWTSQGQQLQDQTERHHKRLQKADSEEGEPEVEWHSTQLEEANLYTDRSARLSDTEGDWKKHRACLTKQMPHVWSAPFQSSISLSWCQPDSFRRNITSAATGSNSVVFHTPLGILILRKHDGSPLTHLPLEPNAVHADFTSDGIVEHMYVHGHNRCYVAAVAGIPFSRDSVPSRREFLFSRPLCRRGVTEHQELASHAHYVAPLLYKSLALRGQERMQGLVIFPSGQVSAIDALSGRSIWTRTLTEIAWEPEAGDRVAAKLFSKKTNGPLTYVVIASPRAVAILDLEKGGRVHVIAELGSRAAHSSLLSVSLVAHLWNPVAIDSDGDEQIDGLLVTGNHGLILVEIPTKTPVRSSRWRVSIFCSSVFAVFCLAELVMLGMRGKLTKAALKGHAQD